MSQNSANDVSDIEMSDENLNISLDFNECEKHMDFLQKFRQICSQFAINCVCLQTNPTKRLFESIEVQYKQIFGTNNQLEDQLNDETIDTSQRSGSSEEIIPSEEPPNDVPNDGSDDELNVDKPIDSNELKTIRKSHSLNSSLKSCISNKSIKSEQNYCKTDKKFNKLLEELKTGSSQSFIDPNNELISVYLRNDNPIDGQNEWNVVFKCNYSYCDYETNRRIYIRKHVDRHQTQPKAGKSSAIKYRIFSNLLEELKNGKIDSFLDPDYNLISVLLRRDESIGEQKEPLIVFKCNYNECQYESNCKYYIRNHVLRHEKDKTFVCKLCDEKFNTKLHLIEHRIEAHKIDENRLFKCEFPDCPYKTTVKQSIEMHSMTHKTEKTVKCSVDGCDMYFKSEYSMKVHRKTVHIGKVFSCDWPGCEARSKSSKYMKTHRLTHTGEKITVGKIRDILKNGNFVSNVDINNNYCSVIRQQIVNENNGTVEIGPKMGYKCNYSDCKFICITPQLMSEHISSHSLGKTFKCDLCDKSYGLRNHLNNHKKVVHNINNKCPLLSCQYCDYKTRNAFCFKQHSLTHQTETPFKCDRNGCEKQFKTELSLRSHIIYCHTKVRPHVCQYEGCESAFKMKSQLTRHMKCHLKGKQSHTCKLCFKAFKFKSFLTKHMKTKH